MSIKTILIKHEESLRSLNKYKLSEVRISNKNISSPVVGISRTSPCVVSKSNSSEKLSRSSSMHNKEVSFHHQEGSAESRYFGDDCQCALGPKYGPGSEFSMDNREEVLRKEYDRLLGEELQRLKDKFDLILQNEQVRTSCLLREAHRERQEKIAALKTQLECKNLAGLMYVLCSERRKSRLEKMRIIEDYTEHIETLKGVVREGQSIMEDMARGYKTASQVDAEWREKTQKVTREFQMFLEHFFGSKAESSQYFFDLPQLLKICAPLVHEEAAQEEEGNLDECFCNGCGLEDAEKKNDTCQCAEAESEEENSWWAKLKTEDRPFVVFGDMGDFPPPLRREVLRGLKEDHRPPPEKWQQYAFNNRMLLAECPNTGYIKHEYFKRLPNEKSYCDQSQGVQTFDAGNWGEGHRLTGGSLDIRHGPMGSLLKIVTQATSAQPVVNKTSILAARDSLELASTTKLHKERRKSTALHGELGSYSEEMDIPSLRVRKKKTSIAPDVESRIVEEYDNYSKECDFESLSQGSKLGSTHIDSLELMPTHPPERTDKIGYEKECPVPACQRKHANSFVRSLPPYMNFTSPFRDYERTFDTYEPCTADELDKLLAARTAGSETREISIDDDLDMDLESSGVYVQTSQEQLPQCMCGRLPDEPEGTVTISPMIPKTKQDHITTSQLFDDAVEFDRFKVIGDETVSKLNEPSTVHKVEDFSNDRAESIVKLLRKYPSMLTMFQAK